MTPMTPAPDALERDIAWLESLKSSGHCGESTSDVIDRQRRNDRIDRLLAALQRRPDREAVADTLRAEVSVLRETLAWIAGHDNALLSDGAPATRACLDALVSRAGAALLATQPQDQNSGGGT